MCVFTHVWNQRRKTDGPHRGDAEAFGQYQKAALTNYAYMVILHQRVLEFVPAESDGQPDVLKAVSCLVWCMLESKSNNGCGPVYVQHIRVAPAKGYCLLLLWYCVQQTKQTCIKGLDSTSLFMWKWSPSKGTKPLSPLVTSWGFLGSSLFPSNVPGKECVPQKKFI